MVPHFSFHRRPWKTMKSLLSRNRNAKLSRVTDAEDVSAENLHREDPLNEPRPVVTPAAPCLESTHPKTRMDQKVVVMRRRYRGFSTSISALFLDEQVVCSAVACCGILASTRTEHLLAIRNARKGVANPTPLSSNVVSISFILTIISLSITYLVWGTNSVNSTPSNRYLTSDSSFRVKGRFIQMQLYKENLWDPFFLHITPELYRSINTWNDTAVTNSSYFLSLHGLHSESIASSTQRSLQDYQTQSNTASILRVIILISFLLILAILGRQQRLRVRYDMIKARIQEDSMIQCSAVTMNRDSYLQEIETVSHGACSHTILGCYPIDPTDTTKDTEEGYEQDISQRTFSLLSWLCCGLLCRTWIQCFSCCALAQEAREARLLVPPKMQRLDLITNQPFDAYYKDIYTLRRGWKGLSSSGLSNHGWQPHFRAFSLLSHSLVILFTIAVTIVILTMMLNPIFSFTIGDAFVILCTFGQSFLLLGIVHGIFHKSDLSLDAVVKFYSAGFLLATSTSIILEGIILNVVLALYYVVIVVITLFTGGTVQNFGDDNYVGFMITMALIESYFVAALSEEFCKYYTFRTVEHPDLIFLTGLDRTKQDDTAKIGGDNAYPFSLDNASALADYGGSFEADYAKASKASKHYRGINPAIRDLGKLSSLSEGDEPDDNPEVRTLNQQAAAITTALISTAVGLACAENFLYVFVLSHGTSTKEEIILLIFRSLFPVHALCAALQSTSIIRKFLENKEADSKRIGVGRIVLPAILLHGTFDTVIMVVNVCIEKYHNAQSIINVIGGVCLVIVMISGTTWYFKENRYQQRRLRNMSSNLQDDEKEGYVLI